MFIEFELQGSKCLHKGVFETTGFWAKFEPETEEIPMSTTDITIGYKIYSHFSFAFYHEDERIAKQVYKGLLDALSGGIEMHLPGVGFIREVY